MSCRNQAEVSLGTELLLTILRDLVQLHILSQIFLYRVENCKEHVLPCRIEGHVWRVLNDRSLSRPLIDEHCVIPRQEILTKLQEGFLHKSDCE